MPNTSFILIACISPPPRTSSWPADQGGARRLSGIAVEAPGLPGPRSRQRVLRWHQGGRRTRGGLERSEHQGCGKTVHQGVQQDRHVSARVFLTRDILTLGLPCRLRTLRRGRPMFSGCVLRIKPVLEKPQTSQNRSQLWPNQVRKKHSVLI